jgi:tyrosine-specific transport protein
MEYSAMKTFLGILLVAGTALGAGMLALPVATATSGLIPAWIVYLLSWLFSMATGLLFVEIGLWLPRHANIVSMANRILGKPGKLLAWIVYIFLFYCLTIAYIAEGGRLLGLFFSLDHILFLAPILFTLIFGSFVYAGTKVAGKCNAVLMTGLIVSFFTFVSLALPKIYGNTELHPWRLFNWGQAIFALPIIFTSFSYQGIIPSLLEFFERDPKKVRIAILFGTLIPFITYLLWDYLIKGIIPIEGAHGLLATKEAGISAIAPLSYFLGGSRIYIIGNFFGFFALTTSFIGVSLGLLDFLSDSLQIAKTNLNKLFLCALVYIPTLLITFINPRIFLDALGYAGGFGCALLLGLLPIVMAWVGRYKKGYSHLYIQLPGGKPILAILFLYVIFEITIQVLTNFV